MDTAHLPLAWGPLEHPMALSVGNPHLVFFVPDETAIELDQLGPSIEHDPAFPERINVNVASVRDDGIHLLTWERGAGLTLRLRHRRLRHRGRGDRPEEGALPGQGPYARRSADHRLGTGRADPDAGRGDRCIQGRDRSGGLRLTAARTITLGCRLNFAESEAMRALAGDDTIIVNSCAVTNEAVRQTRQAIRRAHREAPEKRIVVTGCAAQLDPQAFAAMPEVSRVVGNADKYDASAFAKSTFVLSEVEGRSETVVPAPFDKLRTKGVERRYLSLTSWRHQPHPWPPASSPASGALSPSRPGAIIVAPSARSGRRADRAGRCRTRPFATRSRASSTGAREIVLTGVDITGYENGLGQLCQRLLADLPQLKRLRLSSLDSIEIDDALMELVAGEPRLLPHFHLSLQAGDDLILKRMKRRHSRAQAVATVDRLRKARPDVTIGADLIAGFPTESEEAALNSLRASRRLRHRRRPISSPSRRAPTRRRPNASARA